VQAAARIDDPIAHSNALEGLIAGAVIGAGLAVGAALVIGTGGIALPALIGAGLAGASIGAWIGEFAGSLSFFSENAGSIATGSPDVFVNFKPLARARADTGKCNKDGPEPPKIATGSSNVFINGFRAARVDDKLICGGVIVAGSPDVFIGGGQVKLETVGEEVPGWVHSLVMGGGIVGALLLGGWAVIPGLVGGFAVGYVGGDMMGWVGRQAGDWLSENVGGKPSDWEKGGTFVGQAIGGWLGAKAGPKVWESIPGIEFETNGVGMNGGNIHMPPRQGPLETTNLHEIYIGEEIPNNPYSWTQGQGTVKYFSNAERANYKVTVKNGKLYDANGNLFDTSDAMTWDGRNKAIYVMDGDGNLYIHKTQILYEIHHSSLGQGKPVAGAGEINVRNGVLQYIDNRSGHYQPSNRLFDQTIHELKDQGLSFSNASLRPFR
jgi:uncharacterized Zn-binding protein involved in type VI secretion